MQLLPFDLKLDKISHSEPWKCLRLLHSMSTSPTPEERAEKDKELKAREAEEQARLPYKWTQQIHDVDLTIPVGANIKGRDIEVVITKSKLKVALKGQEPFINVSNLPR